MDKELLFWITGSDPRMKWVRAELESQGFPVTDKPENACTHVVLPLPAFGKNQPLSPEELCRFLQPGMTLLGGKLEPYTKELSATGAGIMDYFTSEALIAANAEITAEGAVSLAMTHLPVTLSGARVLVCGWGRIGQLLAKKLNALGAQVTVSARKPRDLGLISAMGYGAIPTGETAYLSSYQVIFNTIPAPVYHHQDLQRTSPECLLIELASCCGLEADESPRYIKAPGLPGKYAPETAGRLIGRTILGLIGKEQSHDR